MESNSARILAKNIYINNDTRATGNNNNDLIIGPSGAGKTRGYVIPNILQANGSLVVTDTKGRNEALEKYLEKNKKQLKLTAYGVVGIGLMVSPQLYTNIFRQIGEILDKIIAYLKKNNFPGADHCPYCGTPLDGGCVDMLESDIPFRAHEACFNRAYAAAKQREADEEAMPANRLAGMGGAFCGALVGAALFVVLFFWWNFAALGAAVSVFLGGWLYGKFGGKNTLFKVIGVALLTLAVMLLTFFGCLWAQAAIEGQGLSYISEGLSRGGEYLQNFLLNFIFIFVFDLIGTSYAVFSFLRDRKKISANMRRL